MPFRRFLASACLLLLGVMVVRGATPPPAYRTTPVMAQETKTVIELLERVHYLNAPISNVTFDKLITQFMGEIDEQRLFFAAADETQFRKDFGAILPRALRDKGNLDAAFQIFSVYRDRVTARVGWILEELKKDIDLTVDESYAFERDKLPWPATVEEADALWRKRLKFELIPDLVNGKSMDEARTTVSKRYERLRKSVEEFEAPEIQEMFLSTLARMFDPHSSFFTAETHEDFSISMRLSLIGIGALLSSEDGYCVIKELMPGSPALLSKQIQVNDKIIAVAQKSEEPVDVIGMNLRKVVQLIRGQKGTPITLTIIPADASDNSVHKIVTIVRDVVQLNASRAHASIHEVPANDGSTMPIGVISVPSFYGAVDDASASEATSSSVTADVEELLGKLKAAGVKGVVLDLRGNGGGLLDEAVDLTGLFISKGPVVQVRDSYGHTAHKPDTNPRVAYAGPLMVLTSRQSASASEIVAGALQNYGRAIIVGDRSTFGKGTVQAIYDLRGMIDPRTLIADRAGAAKLTIQKYYLPDGSSTQNKGVVPDVSVPAIEDYLPIGEADLPNSLAWDRVDPLTITGRPLDDGLRRLLAEGFRTRVDTLDEFNFLKERINWMRQREEMKAISLNLEKRKMLKAEDEAFREEMKKRQISLAALNYPEQEIKLRAVAEATTPPPAPEATTADADDKDLPVFDVHLRESLRILRDAIEVAPDPAEWTKNSARIAALSARKTEAAVKTN
jgi:carboxyl-terminal processing protease